MTKAEKFDFLRDLCKQLFVQNPKIPTMKNIRVQERRTFRNGIRYIDFEPPGRRLRLLEQNPNKEYAPGQLSDSAKLARQGVQVVWLIDRDSKTNPYLGGFKNGEWTPSRIPGPQKKGPLTAQTETKKSGDSIPENTDYADDDTYTLDASNLPEITGKDALWVQTRSYENENEGEIDADPDPMDQF